MSNDPRIPALLEGIRGLVTILETPAEEVPQAEPVAPAEPTRLSVLRSLERLQGQDVSITFSTEDDEGETIVFDASETEGIYQFLVDVLNN